MTATESIDALLGDETLIVPTVWDVPSAAAAKRAGARALFVGGMTLGASLGYPDIGVVSVPEVAGRVAQIVDATELPVIVDGEIGFGPQPVLGRLIRSLVSAGAVAVMLEDQDETGQSVAAEPGLCSEETMRRRLGTARAVADGRLRILARSDILGVEWPLAQSVERLHAYVDAGADWVTPVFMRSRDEVTGCGEEFPGRLMVITVRSATGYVPSREDVFDAGAVAAISTSQNLIVFKQLVETYRETLAGEFKRIVEAQVDRGEFARAMNYARFEHWTGPPPENGKEEGR